jgi:putative ABC transport system ATP-binding protein
METNETVIAEATDLRKTYGSGDAQVNALAGASVTIPEGSFTAIMGPSGSGKSTLMHCMAGLDTPTSGTIVVSGTRLDTLNDRELTRLRRERIGFVFQAFNLLPTHTARQNIVLPLELAGRKADKDLFEQLTSSLGLSGRLDHLPSQMSGGEQQRVAVCRALITRPAVVFADEPTGALDSRNSAHLLEYLRQAAKAGQTIVMVTHDPKAATYTDRTLMLSDGVIVNEINNPTEQAVLDAMRALWA